jgi:hypothetical protein
VRDTRDQNRGDQPRNGDCVILDNIRPLFYHTLV